MGAYGPYRINQLESLLARERERNTRLKAVNVDLLEAARGAIADRMGWATHLEAAIRKATEGE